MKRTLNSTATAKHIATQNGLTFAYVRRNRMWKLAARNHAHPMPSQDYATAEIADYSTDQFYADCARIAFLTITPQQMEKVVVRIRHTALLDACAGRDMMKDEGALLVSLDPYSADKQVHSVEDSIYRMLEDLEEEHGTYAEHKIACADAAMVGTVSYKTGYVYSNGKEQHAIAYTVDGKSVMSLPARLNGGRIPSLEECADILAGDSVKESDGVRNAAHHLGTVARSIVSDTVARFPGSHVGAALTVTGDGTTAGVKYVMWHGKRSHTLHAVATSPARLMAHWSGFVDTCAGSVAPRVDLSKPAVPDHVASVAVFPQESNAHIMERVRADLAERRTNPAHVYTRMQERRRASVPAVHVEEVEHVDALPAPAGEPGNPCDACGACMHEGQADMCDDCRQDAPAVRNLFQCPICEHEWSDIWTSEAAEDCPNCGARNVTPYDTEEAED